MNSAGREILIALNEWFGKGHSMKPSKRIVHDGRVFWVDIVRNGGYCVQPDDDPNHYMKVWNLAGAAKAITGWKVRT